MSRRVIANKFGRRGFFQSLLLHGSLAQRPEPGEGLRGFFPFGLSSSLSLRYMPANPIGATGAAKKRASAGTNVAAATCLRRDGLRTPFHQPCLTQTTESAPRLPAHLLAGSLLPRLRGRVDERGAARRRLRRLTRTRHDEAARQGIHLVGPFRVWARISWAPRSTSGPAAWACPGSAAGPWWWSARAGPSSAPPAGW